MAQKPFSAVPEILFHLSQSCRERGARAFDAYYTDLEKVFSETGSLQNANLDLVTALNRIEAHGNRLSLIYMLAQRLCYAPRADSVGCGANSYGSEA